MKRVIRLLAFFVVTLLVGVGSAFAYLCWIQATNFTQVADAPHNFTPVDFGIETYQDVRIQSEDGVNLRGWYIPPTREDGATFLFLHGHGGNLLDLMPEAQLYTSMGYGALLFDFRGRGESDIVPVTMGVNETKDASAMLDFLLAQPEVNPERIAIYGNSMGAATAILTAAQRPEIRVVIVDAPYTSIRDLLVKHIPLRTGLPPLFLPDVILWMSQIQSGANFYDANPLGAMPDVTQPILFIHGTLDTLIPYQHSERLHAATDNPSELYIVEGGGHTNNYEIDVDRYQEVVFPFLEMYFTD